jgi:putative ABC transport system substrate-binding protein
MRRREVITLLGGAAASWPLAARAQQAPVPVIGFLSGLSAGDRPVLMTMFRQGLAVTGDTIGRNVELEARYSDNQPERLPALASELIERRVNVIVAVGGNNTGLIAKSLTSTIPIVFTSGFDPVRAGLVKSLVRPEANVTGVSWFSAEIGQKHIELIRELIPGIKTVALLVNRHNPEATMYEQAVREATRVLGLSLQVLEGNSVETIDQSFAQLSRDKIGALLIGGDPFLTARAVQITGLAARHAVPTIYVNREFTEAGGLISYGNSIADAYRRAGIYAGRILKGDKPADLPIDRATKFELVINMREAQKLGIEVPLSLQMRIDEVIE